MKIISNKCDNMKNPVGFDFDRPRLTWICESETPNDGQRAYKLQLATDMDFQNMVYNSGEVFSDQSVGVQPDIDLQPRTRYYWRVAVLNREGIWSDFSEIAFFETARYSEKWQGRFVGAKFDYPQLRKKFEIEGNIVRARLYACGVGMYKMFINGMRVGDEEFAPGINAYDAWLQYQTYDVTALLKTGGNAVGAYLANGYYKGRVNWPGMPERRNIYGDRQGIVADLIIETDSGTYVISTDESWMYAQSPYLRAEIYDGEVFDARLCDPEWAMYGGSDDGWTGAEYVDIDMGKLMARKGIPVRVTEEIKPIDIIHAPNGDILLDFGQNFAGFIRVNVDLPSGAEIRLQTGEVLDKNGNLYRDNLRTALSEQVYISDGKKAVYQPSFTFFGFRYARVLGIENPNPDDFLGCVTHSDMERTGWFECSDARVNRLFLNALWGQRSNFVDNPTDCPQRDERMGWTGDAQVFCPTACMNMDADAFYYKYLYDLQIEQKKMGFVTVTVPNILYGTRGWQIPTTGWSDAALIIPWTMYVHYGDKTILARQYESMKAWVEYMRAHEEPGTHLYGGFHLGDWLAQDTKDADNRFGLTPTGLIATAYYAYSTRILAKTARLLCKNGDADKYSDLADKVCESFNHEYVTPSGRVVSDTQTANVIALKMDLLSPDKKEVTLRQLAKRLVIDHVKLTTGFLGTPYICLMLSENGLNEYAYKLLLEEGCPSWLFEVNMGATTVWERWNSMRADRTFGPVSMNSFNHYAFGAIAEWMYMYAAGIRPCEQDVGFKTVILNPMPNSLLSSANARLLSGYGMIKSGWRLENGWIELEFEVPFNSKAMITLPDAPSVVSENGRDIEYTGTQERGSGRWNYRYKYTGDTIDKRVAGPDPIPY